MTLWEKQVFRNWPCNSIFELYWTLATYRIYMLWVLSEKLQKLQFTAYTVQLITTQLQLCLNNSFSTIMQLPYDYNYNVMLMSFFIHPSKFNMWNYENILWFFWNIDIHHPLCLSFKMVLDYDTWHYQKLSCGILIEFWKQIYICT